MKTELQKAAKEILDKPWTNSKVEEVISVLWLIAALCAWIAQIKWFAGMLLIKSAMDTFCAVGCALAESAQERKEQSK